MTQPLITKYTNFYVRLGRMVGSAGSDGTRLTLMIWQGSRESRKALCAVRPPLFPPNSKAMAHYDQQKSGKWVEYRPARSIKRSLGQYMSPCLPHLGLVSTI